VSRGLLLDEMLSPKIAEQLRRRGHDVYAITERPDLVGLPDGQVLTLGEQEDRVVVTANIADFAALHADWQGRGRPHCGLLYVSTATFPQDRTFLGSLVDSLDQAMRSNNLPNSDETRCLSRASGSVDG
jgi:predicted nuclease of predicted toxin-antitoxin system